MGLNLYKLLKIFILNLQDFLIVIFSVYAAYSLRFDQALNISEIPIFIYLFPGLVFLIIFNFSNFYYFLTRYFSGNTIIRFLKNFFLYFFVILLSVIFLNENEINFIDISTRYSENIPKSFVIIQPLILFFLIILNRFLIFNLVNILKKNHTNSNYNKKKVIVYGAGDLGLQTLNFLEKFKKNFEVVNFIDDNIYLNNQYIQNVKIINFDIFESEKIYKKIDTIYVSFSFNEEKRRKIIDKLSKYKIKIKFNKHINGTLDTNFLVDNKIDINDIVYSRDYSSKINEIKNHYIKKKILITGAAGSIGLNLSKRLTTMKLDTVYLVDNNEYNLFKLKSELNKQTLNCKVKYLLLDISEDYGIKELTQITSCDLIIHVAAYKHVDILETNIASAIKNNIFSTYKLCNIAKKIGAKKFLQISSDKAVKPKNIMGKTKRFCEIIVESYNKIYPDINFSSVRFGNVLNSSGSVIPIFLSQLHNNLPITITSKKVTRYFMSIPEAISLILLTLTIIKPRKIYIFDMGKKIKIFDIAKRIVSMYGYSLKKNPKYNYEYKYKLIGLKKGEKMHEILTYQGKLNKTKYEKILETNNSKRYSKKLMIKITNQLKKNIDQNNKENLMKILNNII